MAEELLKRGAPVNLRDKEGSTPLDVALASGEMVLAAVLRERRATESKGRSGKR
jgi:ankyrin repeat protein